MPKLIQDVVPPATLKKLPSNEVLIAALYIRGVTVEEIFGRFYEYESHASADDDDEEGQHGRAPLTVGDVQLAGLAELPGQPQPRQPF